MLRRRWEGLSLLDGGMLACLDCCLPVWTLRLDANVPTMAFSYSEGFEGFLDAIDAIDAAERLQQNVSVTIAGLNVVGPCGLYTYIDISITRILPFTLAFTMPVSILYMMANKLMRPDAGNGTPFWSHCGLELSGIESWNTHRTE